MIRLDPLILFLRLTFLTLIASGFTFLAFTYVALSYVEMDQVFGLWGGGCAFVAFVWAAMVADAVTDQVRREPVCGGEQ